MGFRSIVRKTLIDLSGWKRVLGLIVLGLVVPVLAGVAWRSSGIRDLSLEMQTYYVVSNFLTVSLIWIAGFFLAFLVATNAAGAISKEVAEGTLLPLVSKPISRRHIVLGKFAAIAVNAIVLEAIILVLLAVILRFVLPIGTVSLLAMLGAIPWILLYSILVILVFGAISMFLSALMESQIRIMVAVMAVVIFVFGIGAILHMMHIQEAKQYQQFHLYLIDPLYQLGNGFIPTMKQVIGDKLLPLSHLEGLQQFTGIFKNEEGFVSGLGVERPAEVASYTNPAVSIIISLAIFAVALWGALWAMERKDVH